MRVQAFYFRFSFFLLNCFPSFTRFFFFLRRTFFCAIFCCFTARSSSEFHLNFNVGRFRRSLYYALFVISGWHNILVSSTFIHLNRIFECTFCFICVWVLFHIHAIQFYLDPSCFFLHHFLFHFCYILLNICPKIAAGAHVNPNYIIFWHGTYT